MNAKVSSVNSVCFNIEKSDPPQLVLHAIGKVNSSGWSGPNLVPRVYVIQPTDGIQDFDFYAKPPAGKVLWVVTPVAAETTIVLERWISGIRVHSATNSLTTNLSDIACTAPLAPISDQILRNRHEELDYFKRMDGDGGIAPVPMPTPPDMPKKEIPGR
jgi:hypothetical protein